MSAEKAADGQFEWTSTDTGAGAGGQADKEAREIGTREGGLPQSFRDFRMSSKSP